MRAALLLLLLPVAAHADHGVCKIVDVGFMPAEIATPAAMRAPSQIVAWLETTSGLFVDTLFITQETGTFGLGNRPGRFDFNSGPGWPYGRRITVFPVWAHRHGLAFDEVVFQDGQDNSLSHMLKISSDELHYCRPIMTSEPMWDAGSCATSVDTDKGRLGPGTSKYPPRVDLALRPEDDPSVELFALLNPFDGVSTATPPSGVPASITWVAPDFVPDGEYVLWIEVSREFDHNATYSIDARPAPNVSYGEYGAPYRGQPSVVWSVPFTIGPGRTVARALDYAGYGDPDGASGTLFPPDGTISTGVQGSGAERLAIQSDGGSPYRVRIEAHTELDSVVPAKPADFGAKVTRTSATLQFTAPGDDGDTGRVRRYEIRYRAGKLDETNFADGIEVRPRTTLVEAGDLQEIELTGLLDETQYTVGIRAIDDCNNRGPLAFHSFTTSNRGGEVPWCFIATAAYGSAMANDVEKLRHFRDALLQHTVLGELAVEAYYTFSPALAGMISESDVLRLTARAVIAPIVTWVRALRF